LPILQLRDTLDGHWAVCAASFSERLNPFNVVYSSSNTGKYDAMVGWDEAESEGLNGDLSFTVKRLSI
jgi:hypothetical protein